MNKFKKLRFAFAVVLLLTVAGPPRPAFAWFDPTTLQTKTRVNVSTTCSSPTQIVAPLAAGGGSVYLMLNWSGSGTKPNSEALLLTDTNAAISTQTLTGASRIPAGNGPSEFFWLDQYSGGLWACVVGTTTAQVVDVFRKK